MWKLILLILAGLYTLNPFDILPDLMIGWGWIDDIIIWVLLWRYLVSQNKKYTNYSRFYQQDDARFENSNYDRYTGRQRSGPQDHYSESDAPWDAHRVLGIDKNASAAEIKHAYRELANKYHPDKLEHLGDEFKTLAEIRFKEIQKAYQELTGKGA